AVHVVESERIGLEFAHRGCERMAVVPGFLAAGKRVARPFLLDGFIAKVGVLPQGLLVIAAGIARGRAGTASGFPLRFCRQAIGLVLFLAQPVAELLGVVPADADHGMIVGLVEAGIEPVGLSVHPPCAIREMTPGAAFSLGLRLVACRLDELTELADRDL